MFFSRGRNRRRRELVAQPFPAEWRQVLEQLVRHYQFLNAQQHERLEGFVQVLLSEKDWVGGGGFELHVGMKVTIAGYAGVMTLGMKEPYYFDRLKTIIVYPGGYQPHMSRYDQYQPIGPIGARLGEAHYRGPIVVSWAEIVGREKLRPGNNLVFHEFAHHIDGLDGEVEGTPPLVGREKALTWYDVTEQEFERLRGEASRGEATLLDRYGASNRAEFFAVASECFFERPRAMRERHPELYRVLADFYCQDVAQWLPDAAPQESP